MNHLNCLIQVQKVAKPKLDRKCFSVIFAKAEFHIFLDLMQLFQNAYRVVISKVDFSLNKDIVADWDDA